MNIPPASELMDFESFASVMNAGPIKDIHRYYDSDNEQDLEDDYDGADPSDTGSEKENIEPTHQQTSSGDEILESADHENVADDGQVYDFIDPRQVDHSKSSESHAKSIYLDPEIQALVDRTDSVLEKLSIRAQTIIDEQPLSTQIVLANQAHDQVLRPYGQHGSQARFSESVMKFLAGGDTVRRPGKDGRSKAKDGKLKLAEIDPNEVPGDHTPRAVRKRYDGHDSDGNDGPMKTLKVRDGRQNNFGDAFSLVTKKRKGTGSNNDEDIMDRHTGSAPGMVESLSFRKTSDPVSEWDTRFGDTKQDIHMVDGSFSRHSQLQTAAPTSSPFTPLANSFSNSLQLNSLAETAMHDVGYQQDPEAYSCTYHPSANADLAKEEYNPISLDITWPASTQSDGVSCMPTPGLLDALNRIVHLTNAEARFMLSYYVRKYETPMRLGGRASGIEPPHALFRLGISQYLHSKVDNIINRQESDELGLNPEARRVLGEAWERHPSIQTWFGEDFDVGDVDHEVATGPPDDGQSSAASTSQSEEPYVSKVPVKGGLNPLEKTLLARACVISPGTVDAYWDRMRGKTFAWAAMKQWCQVRSLEKITIAKSDDPW